MNDAINKAVLSEITPININGKESTRLMIVLRTKGCSYARKFGGCKHCNLIRNSNQSVTIDNLKRQLETELGEYKTRKFEHLDLLTLGSFFDEEEIPSEFFRYALTYISEIKSLKKVMVESRPEFVTREKIKEAVNTLGDVKLEVGIGIESSDEFIRSSGLNKGFSLSEVENAVKILAEFDVELVGYVLVKPIGLNEEKAIEDSVKTIEYVFSLGKKHNVRTRIALEPFYVPKSLSVEIKYKYGEYQPVKLWSVMEVIKRTNHLGNIFVGLNDEGLSDKGLMASNCDSCSPKVIGALNKYNGTNDLNFLKNLNCSCKEEWENKIKKKGKRIAVCLLSGGMDSCVAATLTKQAGDELYLLSINWGQTLVRELENAKKISQILQPKEHMILDMKNYNQLSHSALTAHHQIPKGDSIDDHQKDIPVSYPPGRDPTFIMVALSWLESIMLNKIKSREEITSGRVIIGTNKEDSLVYPDCHPEVYALMNRMFCISTKIGKELRIPIDVQTPLIRMAKKGVLAKGLEIGAPVEHTYSCHKGEEKLCGECDPCRIIYFGFKDLGIKNQFRYQKIPEKRY